MPSLLHVFLFFIGAQRAKKSVKYSCVSLWKLWVSSQEENQACMKLVLSWVIIDEITWLLKVSICFLLLFFDQDKTAVIQFHYIWQKSPKQSTLILGWTDPLNVWLLFYCSAGVQDNIYLNWKTDKVLNTDRRGALLISHRPSRDGRFSAALCELHPESGKAWRASSCLWATLEACCSSGPGSIFASGKMNILLKNQKQP